MSAYDLETTIQLPDEEDVDVYIEFEVDSWGSPGCGPSLTYPGDPPEPPEFGITKVVRLDNDKDITDEVLELPTEGNFRRNVEDLVFQRVCEIDESRGYED